MIDKTATYKKRARRRPPKAAPESMVEMIDRLLMTKVKAGTKTITALEAILYQLTQHEADGNMAAARVLNRYEKLAQLKGERKHEITFQDADTPEDPGNGIDGGHG